MASAESVLASKRAGFVGLGRLGLCTALTFERAGWNIVGSDVSQAYVDSINSKTLRSDEPEVEAALRRSTKLRATTDLQEVIQHADLVFILVATPPSGNDREAYDTSTLSKVLEDISNTQPTNKHIVICCTILPGYISQIGSFLLEGCEGCSLSYNPEFIAQGEVMKGLSEPDLVLIGEGSSDAGDILQRLYEDVSLNTPKICRMSPQSAEIMKLSLNCFITTKISFANMIGDIADATPNANKFEILASIGCDSRVGHKCITPGYGFGGPCFPRDNRALGMYARTVGVEATICEAVDSYNNLHASTMAQALLDQNRDVYVLSDVAYKSKCPVAIIDESQPLEVARKLVEARKKVIICDRAAIISSVKRKFGRLFKYEVQEDP